MDDQLLMIMQTSSFRLILSYESKGSFINLTGQVQEFNQELLLPNHYYSNEALLSDLVNERDLDIPSFNDFMKGLESFIRSINC